MANQPILFLIRSNRVQAFRSQLKNNPVLDPMGGGDFLFPSEYRDANDPTNTDPNTVYYGGTWHQSEDQFTKMLGELSGYVVNNPVFVPGTEIAYYVLEEGGWNWETALADDSERKNRPLVLHYEPPDPANDPDPPFPQ